MSKVHSQTLLDEMIRQLALPRAQVKRAAEELLALVQEGLQRDGEVYISNFGTFRLKPVAERKGINPQTREAMTIPAHYRVMFSPCKALREAIKTSEQPVTPEAAASPEPPPSHLRLSEAHQGEDATTPPETGDIVPSQGQDIPHPAASVSSSETPQTPPSSSAAVDMSPSEQDSDTPPTRETDTPVPANQASEQPETVQETVHHDIQPALPDSLSPDTVKNTASPSPHKARLGKGHIALAVAVLVCSLVAVEFSMDEKDATDKSKGMETVSEAPLANVTTTLAASSAPNLAPQRQSAHPVEEKPAASLPGERGDVVIHEQNAFPPQAKQETVKEESKTNLSRSLSSQPSQSPHYFEERRHEVTEGESLWRLASRHYSTPLLWPHIFQANAGIISNPDKLVVGQSIIIPTLEGGPTELTAQDRLNIAEGYYLTYLFYKKNGRKDAFFALLEAKRYDSKVIEKHRRTLHLSQAEQVLLDVQTSSSF